MSMRTRARVGFNRIVFLTAVLLCVVTGCSQKPDVVVLSRSMHQEADVNPGIPDEFAQSAPSSRLFWVEGRVQNLGSAEVRNVEVLFVATDGNNRMLMIAKIGKIGPGETLQFSTGKSPSSITLHLVQEDPEINIDH
jgi:hypothetical protein